MKTVEGDIWDYIDTHWLCVTTNLGWNKRGENVMGRGLAKQAADRYPELPKIYGSLLTGRPVTSEEIETVKFTAPREAWLIMFPTKKLNHEAPYMSWKSKSDIDLIVKGMHQIDLMFHGSARDVAVVPFGCSNGGLDPKVVIPIMEEVFKDNEQILLVLPQKKTADQADLPY